MGDAPSHSLLRLSSDVDLVQSVRRRQCYRSTCSRPLAGKKPIETTELLLKGLVRQKTIGSCSTD